MLTHVLGFPAAQPKFNPHKVRKQNTKTNKKDWHWLSWPSPPSTPDPSPPATPRPATARPASARAQSGRAASARPMTARPSAEARPATAATFRPATAKSKRDVASQMIPASCEPAAPSTQQPAIRPSTPAVRPKSAARRPASAAVTANGRVSSATSLGIVEDTSNIRGAVSARPASSLSCQTAASLRSCSVASHRQQQQRQQQRPNLNSGNHTAGVEINPVPRPIETGAQPCKQTYIPALQAWVTNANDYGMGKIIIGILFLFSDTLTLLVQSTCRCVLFLDGTGFSATLHKLFRP